MIPAEFQESTFETFKILQPIHQKMLDVANRYLADFDDLIKNETANGLGFIAEFGESRLKAIQDPQERAKMKTKYNSYGLGKTHLTVAIGKKLLERGIPVLFISDAVVMDELTLLKTSDKDQYMKKWSSLIEVPVLIWDDLGKSNYSEAKKAIYYQIINERYKRRGIIIYSSNEDTTTLEMRLGDASMSRLYAMSKGRIIRCSGIDMRLVGGIAQ